MKLIGSYPSTRLRRNRKNEWSRRLVSENNLSPKDLIWPIFLTAGKNQKNQISTMPEVYRYSVDQIEKIVEKALKLKLPLLALFPHTQKRNKDKIGSEALNENNLVCKALKIIKNSNTPETAKKNLLNFCTYSTSLSQIPPLRPRFLFNSSIT